MKRYVMVFYHASMPVRVTEVANESERDNEVDMALIDPGESSSC